MNQKEHRFTIGRARDCDIVLSDDTVSRRHAELTFLGDGKLFIIDCHSTRGTSLVTHDGRLQPVGQELITPTDTLQFGDIRLSVKEILEAIRLKFPSFSYGGIVANPNEPAPAHKPWVQGKRLVRCECGAVKSKQGTCLECGR